MLRLARPHRRFLSGWHVPDGNKQPPPPSWSESVRQQRERTWHDARGSQGPSRPPPEPEEEPRARREESTEREEEEPRARDDGPRRPYRQRGIIRDALSLMFGLSLFRGLFSGAREVGIAPPDWAGPGHITSALAFGSASAWYILRQGSGAALWPSPWHRRLLPVVLATCATNVAARLVDETARIGLEVGMANEQMTRSRVRIRASKTEPGVFEIEGLHNNALCVGRHTTVLGQRGPTTLGEAALAAWGLLKWSPEQRRAIVAHEREHAVVAPFFSFCSLSLLHAFRAAARVTPLGRGVAWVAVAPTFFLCTFTLLAWVEEALCDSHAGPEGLSVLPVFARAQPAHSANGTVGWRSHPPHALREFAYRRGHEPEFRLLRYMAKTVGGLASLDVLLPETLIIGKGTDFEKHLRALKVKRRDDGVLEVQVPERDNKRGKRDK